MPQNFEQGGIPIRQIADIARIKGVAEQRFARLLLEKTALVITYEPTFFQHHNGERLEGTTPDFRVKNPRTGAETYIEITGEDPTEQRDPKEKQKRVMRSFMPGVHYVVFYRKKLLGIQSRHPEYNFFNGSKVRDEGKEYDLFL